MRASRGAVQEGASPGTFPEAIVAGVPL